MVTKMCTYVFLLAFFLLGLAAFSMAEVAPSDITLAAPFARRDDEWIFAGSTVMTESYLRLTPAEAGHEGSVWRRQKLEFTEWEVSLMFRLSGARYLGGDGFAVWFTEQMGIKGNTFGNQDDYRGVGVIFDTYDNDGKRDNPSISAVKNDGTTKFDHDSDGSEQRMPGALCKMNFRNLRNPIEARIKYSDETKTLQVSFDSRGFGSFVNCFSVSNVEIPRLAHFGITAHTGQVADNHDIYSVTIKDRAPHKHFELPPDVKQPLPPAEQPVPVPDPVQDAENHKWKPDDDRHLSRVEDAALKWDAASPQDREVLMREREKAHNQMYKGMGSAPVQENRRAQPAEGFNGGGHSDDVSVTLAAIQAEIKAIAHEMRGTITLAHAVTAQQNAETEGENGGATKTSASDLLVGVGDMIVESERQIVKDVNSLAGTIKLELSGMQQSVEDLKGLIRSNLLRTEQEVSSKLSTLVNEVEKLKATVNNVHQKQDGHTQIITNHHNTLKSQLSQFLTTKPESGGEFSLLFVLLTQLPWIIYLVVSIYGGKLPALPKMGGGGRGSSSPFGMNDSYGAAHKAL